MDFSLSPDEQAAVDAFARYVEGEVRPVAERHGDAFIPKEEMSALLAGLLPYGMGNGLVAEANGGLGLPAVLVGHLFEELARVSPDLGIVVLIQLEAGLLLEAGSDSLRESYLAPLLAGEKFGCIGISEPGAGSNIAEISCRAERDGDDWRIRGEKQWISNGHYSDFCICVARVDEEDERGIALFVVDRADGYESRNIPKMALNAQSTAQLFFDDVRVPGWRQLAGPKEGLRTLLALLQGSRPLVGLLATGVGRAALDASIAYARERQQHGGPIAGHQLVQARIAEMATRLDAARLLIYRALDKAHRGERSEVESAMAKLFAADALAEITRHAVAVHGGNGVTPEYPVEKFYRMAPILNVTEGTDEMQKLIIGRSLLGVPAF